MSKHVVRAAIGLLSASAAIVGGAYFGPITMDAASAITALEERRQELIDASQALVDAADEADEDISAEDLATIEANAAEAEKLEKQIKARKALLPTGQGRRTAPEPQNRNEPGQRQTVPASARNNDPRGGFRNFGEFAASVRSGSIQGNQPDQRLMNAASTYGNEGTGADGGFLVPPEFSREIMVKVEAEEGLLNRAEELKTGTNSMTIPKDETTPWQSTGGVQVYWEGEGAAITQSKGVFETATHRLVKLTALVPVSDELLEDAIGMESWLRAKAPAKMASKINTAFVRGSGVGQPLGMLNAPSHISVAKETSQPADTIYFANINKMWSRMYAPWRRNAIWLINQDIEPQLEGMAFDPAATSKVPVYLPAGGASASPYASLKGRPVVPMEACSTLGDKGDIILVDMKQYWALKKAAGIRTDTSIHLFFDQALTTFRFIFRLNGMPAWSSVITPENGNTTRSWAVTLDERA
ncbi:phage major capsid protein [Mesorhizobium sp.]|uniref:phage major capsid protein n=1 Tax=Mesorhizobium sp. TaxID=1871066 RepID=UPI000FE3CAB2|nr:phage major capsid protein [Mesorhizobium sp.]RWQ16100.1 MAG: phage major capsid protein [Mesorhizobium sp.]